MSYLWLTNQWTLAHSCKRKYFQKTKTHRETCPNEPGTFLKFCFFVSKIKMVVYSEFEIKFIPLLITFLLNKPFFTKKASFDDLFSLLMMSYYCANFLTVAVILPNFLKWTLWYRGILKKIDNFLYAVFSIWKSLRVLEKACIKIVPRAIYKYLFFFFCKNCPFLLPNKKLLGSLFSLTN